MERGACLNEMCTSPCFYTRMNEAHLATRPSPFNSLITSTKCKNTGINWSTMKKNFKTLFLSSSLTLLSACGAMKNLGDMHDSTAEMNTNMKTMLSKMSHMDDGMTEMSKKMDALPSMESKMSHMDAGMSEMSKKMDALPAMQKAMDTLTAKMDLLTEMNNTMKSLGKNMDGMSNKMDALPQMLTAMADMSKKMDALPAMQKAMDLMSTKMDALPTMQAAMETLTKRMDLLVTMNETMNKLREDMGGMSKKMDALPQMLEAMAAMTKKMDLLTDMKIAMGEMSTKMDALPAMQRGMDDMSKKMDALPQMLDAMAKMTEKMNKLDDMKAAMGEMNTKMDALPTMNQNMVDLKEFIKKMNATLDLTYADLRLIFTTQHQIDALKAMEASNDQSAKFGYAAEYMVSQTYQGWNANAESEEVRMNLMGIAVPSFFFKVTNYIANRNSFNPSGKSGQEMDLYAICATLDYINTVEIEKIKNSNYKPVTMLSMIEDALRLKQAVNKGILKITDLPTYQQEILNHEQDAIYLLRVRQNFLKGVVIAISKQHENGNPKTKVGLMINGFTSLFTGSVGHNLDAQNISEIETLAIGLDKAAETEQFLVDIGVDPKNDSEVSYFLRKLDPAQIDDKASKAEVEHFNSALRRIVDLDKRN